MPQGQNEAAAATSERLANALSEAGVSVRALARELAGDSASAKRVDDVRGYIYRWLRGQGISPTYAEQLERLLGKPSGYFMPSQPQQARSVAARLAALEEEVDDLTVALRAAKKANQVLQRRVGALEQAVPLQAVRPGRGSTRRGAGGQ